MTLPRKPLKIAKLYNCMTLFRTNDRDPVNKSQKWAETVCFSTISDHEIQKTPDFSNRNTLFRNN